MRRVVGSGKKITGKGGKIGANQFYTSLVTNVQKMIVNVYTLLSYWKQHSGGTTKN